MSDIQGTFHIHTEFSDGIDSIEKIVQTAKRLEFTYIGISDHSKSAYYAGGLKVEDLYRQWEIIDASQCAGNRIFTYSRASKVISCLTAVSTMTQTFWNVLTLS